LYNEKKKYSYVSNPEVITLNSTKSKSESDEKGYVKITKTASRKYVVEVETKGGDRKQFNDTWSLDELEKAEKFAKKSLGRRYPLSDPDLQRAA
jgi:hypothetical protein